MRDLNERRFLAEYGVHYPDAAIYAEDAWRNDVSVAMDAQPGLTSGGTAGIPGFLTNIVDPQVIRTITQPMAGAMILGGEQKMGDWTTLSAQFPSVEAAGQVASYGDYSNNGVADFAGAYTPRQSYHYQTHIRYGERELAMWGVAAINAATEKENAAALVMNKFQNRSYFYGIAGLQNYGILNDPNLIAPITPAAKAAGGTTWTPATAQEIYEDIRALFKQLNLQMGYNIRMTDPLVLTLSSNRMPDLEKLSPFNVSVMATLRAAYPNLTIETAPEYSTPGGEFMQLMLREFDGVKTGFGAFTEKMRSHALVTMTSWWQQKKSGGTWGAIIRRPTAIAGMLGI